MKGVDLKKKESISRITRYRHLKRPTECWLSSHALFFCVFLHPWFNLSHWSFVALIISSICWISIDFRLFFDWYQATHWSICKRYYELKEKQTLIGVTGNPRWKTWTEVEEEREEGKKRLRKRDRQTDRQRDGEDGKIESKMAEKETKESEKKTQRKKYKGKQWPNWGRRIKQWKLQI